MGRNVIYTALLEEPWSFITHGIILVWLNRLFSPELSQLYLILLVIEIAAWMISKFGVAEIFLFNAVSGNSLRSFQIALVYWAGFLVASSVIAVLLQFAANFDIAALIQRMSGTIFGSVEQPLLASNPLVTLAVGSFFVGTLETRSLIAHPLALLKHMFKLDLRLGDPKTWAVLAVVGFIGVTVHLQVKQVTDNVALITTFLFWIVSAVMIIRQKESEGAVYAHWVNNLVALGSKIFGR